MLVRDEYWDRQVALIDQLNAAKADFFFKIKHDINLTYYEPASKDGPCVICDRMNALKPEWRGRGDPVGYNISHDNDASMYIYLCHECRKERGGISRHEQTMPTKSWQDYAQLASDIATARRNIINSIILSPWRVLADRKPIPWRQMDHFDYHTCILCHRHIDTVKTTGSLVLYRRYIRGNTREVSTAMLCERCIGSAANEIQRLVCDDILMPIIMYLLSKNLPEDVVKYILTIGYGA